METEQKRSEMRSDGNKPTPPPCAGKKNARGFSPRAQLNEQLGSGLLHQTGFDRLDGYQNAFGPSVGQFHANALQIGTKFSLGDASHVRADAAALLGLALAVDDRAFDRTTTGDCTDSSHDDIDLIKGSGVKDGDEAKQGDFSRARKPDV